MLLVTWNDLKNYWSENQDKVQLNYIEFSTKYIVWCQYRQLQILCDSVFKTSEDGLDFEENYKSYANNNEADKFRITTARIGSKLTFHYAEFTTAKLNSLDNEDINGVDDGSLTLVLKDSEGNETQIEANAVATEIIFGPAFTYDVAGGEFFVPATLAGNDDDAWEAYALASPDIIDHQYLRHCHLSWFKGQKLIMDSSIDPGELPYIFINGVQANRIKIIIKHPQGAQSKFCAVYRYFK